MSTETVAPTRAPGAGRARSLSPRARAWRRFRRHPKGLAASAVLLLIVLAVAVGPVIDGADPTKIDLTAPLAGASAAHPLGTDENGRDVLVRLLVGGRVSLLVGAAAMAVAVALGVMLGSLAGFFGGLVDRVVVQLVDGMMAVPLFFLWLIFLTTVRPTLLSIVLIIGVTSWMPTARVVRSEILRTRELEFVEAAHSIGASRWRTLRRHCLPQATSSIIVSASLAAAFAIISESALSFLGIGIQEPQPSWGNMLSAAQQYVFSKPVLAVYPGVAILVTVLALNLLGDALRDVLNPRG